MLKISVGDYVGASDREGMQVTPGPFGLMIQLYAEPDDTLSTAVSGDARCSFTFADVQPFALFCLEAEGVGSAYSWWSMARVPDFTKEKMRACCSVMLEQNSGDPDEPAFPAILVLVRLDGHIYGSKNVPMRQKHWRSLAAALLRQPMYLNSVDLQRREVRMQRQYVTPEQVRAVENSWTVHFNRPEQH